MSLLKVARLGHPVLRQKARQITRDELRSPAMQKFIDDLAVTMRDEDGVGLAAPQVHESISLLVIEIQADPRTKTPAVPLLVLANPRLSRGSKEMDTDWEGCLSVPGLRGKVPRHRSIEVEALDRNADPVVLKATGFLARVIQHEADHLEGKVFLDRMTDLASLSFIEEFQRYGGQSSQS